jgi:hypothetical protein
VCYEYVAVLVALGSDTVSRQSVLQVPAGTLLQLLEVGRSGRLSGAGAASALVPCSLSFTGDANTNAAYAGSDFTFFPPETCSPDEARNS